MQTGPLDILIGADYCYKLVHPGYEMEGNLILLLTRYGYALSGSCKDKETSGQVELVTVLKLGVTIHVRGNNHEGKKSIRNI